VSDDIIDGILQYGEKITWEYAKKKSFQIQIATENPVDICEIMRKIVFLDLIY
jgi:hypothetical protein